MKVKGLEESRKRLRQRAERVRGDSGKLYPDLGKQLSTSVKKTFNAQGRDPKWAKRKGTYSHPIFGKTGFMRDAAESTALESWEVQGTTHTLPVKGPSYGQNHQYGTVNLPERKYVKPTEPEKTKMRDRVRKEWNIK